MDAISAIVQFDEFAKLAGIEILEAGEGNAKARMRITRQHLNGVGIVHGGAIFTLADLAFAAACNSRGKTAVAINASISYAKAATAGTLVAEATEVFLGPKMGTYTVHVKDDKGDIIAVFQGLAYQKGSPASVSSPAANRGPEPQ